METFTTTLPVSTTLPIASTTLPVVPVLMSHMDDGCRDPTCHFCSEDPLCLPLSHCSGWTMCVGSKGGILASHHGERSQEFH